MSVANLVNVSEILNLNSSVTVDQVEALRSALMGHQAGEVRQGLTELNQKIDAGGASEAMIARAGVASYLLLLIAAIFENVGYRLLAALCTLIGFRQRSTARSHVSE